MSKFARRKDVNHSPIEEVFRQLLADHVTDISATSGGLGDLYISFGAKRAYGCFVEIKRDEKADYTAAQIRFQRTHPGCVHRVETVEQAYALAQWVRAQVTQLSLSI